MTKYLKRSLDYCLAVRSALTADGQEPLEASGLKLHERLTKIYAKFRTGSEKGGLPVPLIKLKQILSKGLEQTAAMWVPIAVAYDWIHNAAQILKNEAGLDGRIVQLCFQALLKAMSACQAWAEPLQSGIVHFLARYRQLLGRAIPLLLSSRFTQNQ